MSSYRRKSWKEKMNPGMLHHIETTEKSFADIPAGADMLIATPTIVNEYIRSIPSGHQSDIKTMRKDLAARFHADYTCPVTSGIFVRIVAEAALEDLEAGKQMGEVTPFWRILDEKSPAAKKLSHGQELLQMMREKENLN